MPHSIDCNDVSQFDSDGFVIVEELFSEEEVGLLLQIARADKQISENASDRLDADGATTRLSLRNVLGEDIYSAIVRSPRVVKAMEQLLRDEVYHYHHKVMLKEPRVGGAWEWHQDYGYWYNNGCLYPTMASCYIAIDQATKENGCLQVIRGSHQIGRVDHLRTDGGQTGADMDRVNAALERMEHLHVEMSPGSALFFHGNLLHRSDRNSSENPRWSLICCYNTRGNDPFKKSHHPNYHPLPLGNDEDVLSMGKQQWAKLADALG